MYLSNNHGAFIWFQHLNKIFNREPMIHRLVVSFVYDARWYFWWSWTISQLGVERTQQHDNIRRYPFTWCWWWFGPPFSWHIIPIPWSLHILSNYHRMPTGWWFGPLLILHILGRIIPTWLSYFSEGWLNHQPARSLSLFEHFEPVSGAAKPWSCWMLPTMVVFCFPP